ncbi:glycosyltransferase family 2 protein, partial [Leucobacter komagatae]|uniref:glycosyltransferase family 2 protein n=1 Tax=Leucobacter komagatae TaxID=55969 RepID=UPI001E49CC81
MSVIIPIYNVERFLRECLESVRVQSYPDIEVIMVNDGSPDGSEKIAREFAKKDRRFKLVTKKNAGLGAARNTGIRVATGKYITFLDSDDVVTADAYREMVMALNKSGSDFVVGGVERWRARATWKDDWASRVHGRDQLAAKLDDIAEVTKDVFAWNKLFRTAFFHEQLGEFPEGILYEDQELTARAYTRSKSFDLLEKTTYLWRIREDGTSITQGKLTDRDLRDRITVAHRVHEIYRDHASPEVYSYWKQKTAALDFGFYYRLSHRGSDEYWNMLVEFTRFLFDVLSEEDWTRVPVQERVLCALIASDDKPQSERVINAQAQFVGDLPTVETEGTLRVDLEQWGVSQEAVPEFVQALYEGDSALRTGLKRVEWLQPGRLALSGFAYIDKMPATIDQSQVRLLAVRSDGLEAEVPVERFEFDKSDPTLPRTAYAEYPASGIRAVVDVSSVLSDSGEQLTFRIEYQRGSVQRSGAWLPQNNENSFGVLPHSPSNGYVLGARADRRDGVVVWRNHSPVSISNLDVVGRRIQFTVVAIEPLRSANVRFVNLTMLNEVNVALPDLEPGSETRVSAELPLRAKAWERQFETVWSLELVCEKGTYPLPYPEGTQAELLSAETGAVAVRPSGSGWLEIIDSRWRAVVERVVTDGNRITVAGAFNAQTADTPRIVMLRVDGVVL